MTIWIDKLFLVQLHLKNIFLKKKSSKKSFFVMISYIQIKSTCRKELSILFFLHLLENVIRNDLDFPF